MTGMDATTTKGHIPRQLRRVDKRGITIPIATKLILGYVAIIALISALVCIAGVSIIGNRIVSEAQAKVRTDLNSARAIYLSYLNHVHDVVRFTADRWLLINALLSRDIEQATLELKKLQMRERLDVLTVTDVSGRVLLRTSNVHISGDDQSHDALVRYVLQEKKPVSSTTVISAAELEKENPELVRKAYFKFIRTPKARPRKETEETSGMMLKAAAPIFDYKGQFIGAIYGAILLNRNFEIVDRIKQTVFQGVKYRGKDIGTATLFQDDVRISTNVENVDGSRAIGTRIAADVYHRVIKEGKPWIGRAYVVKDWYITAYEPIRDINKKIIGILYVGLLEQKYVDMKRRTIITFLTITFLGVIISTALSCYIARRISGTIRNLVVASQEVARGNLDAKVQITSHDELRDLAESFNQMASALKARDEQLKEYAQKKIMESERLAIIGQLAADVAHELNNPLQGIVTFSHLLAERLSEQDETHEYVQKIVVQANRCTGIVRGLLDFARQRKPQMRMTHIDAILQECISLVENQALFHNIKVVKDFGEDVPPIVVDPSQIQQIFTNMIINAAEAMEGNGELTIATRFDASEECVEVQFADTGHGISEQNMERIFDPFFTTKPIGHGTGLGLAISHGIIKEHGGTITVESEVGKGTTFVIRLPVRPEKSAGNGESVQDTHC